MSGMRTGETIQAGQVIPEAEVVRDNPKTAAPFQTREAATIYQGPRGRRKRTAGGDACATEDARPTEPGQAFQVRAAVTVELPPPHWAKLTQQEESDHAHHSGPDTNSGKAGSL